MRRRLLAVAMSGAVLGLVSCTSPSTPDAEPTPTPSSTPTPTVPPPTAQPQPRPQSGDCYDLEYAEALSPTSRQEPVACASDHTTVSSFVGTLPELRSGHLLAVDSGRVQQAVADTCRAKFAAYVGGSTAARRLSLLRPVWFTPSLRQADKGANWLRCDVVALSGDSSLARLTDDPKGVVGRKPDAYSLCGTAQPGTKDFSRVLCRDAHSWRAVSVVDLPGKSYPGEQSAKSRAAGPCKQQGANNASDPLDYQWGSEVPTREQWNAGTTWATCWVPD